MDTRRQVALSQRGRQVDHQQNGRAESGLHAGQAETIGDRVRRDAGRVQGSREVAKKAAKRARRPIYMVPRRMIDAETGEEMGALVPSHPIDRRLMRERGFRRDVEIRAELKQSRNPAFHRLMHAVGHLMVDNVESFAGKGAHEAIKDLQLESGVMCEMREISATPVINAVLAVVESVFGNGAAKLLSTVLPDIKTVQVKEARSLAFDEMTEDEFGLLFNGITAWIGDHYAHVMLDEVRAEFWLMVSGDAT